MHADVKRVVGVDPIARRTSNSRVRALTENSPRNF